MRIRFYLDPETARPHVENHGVTTQEVTEAFGKRGEDRPGREGSRVAIGHTRAGRVLRLVYAPDNDGDGVFVITAYELKGKPLTAYNRRRRRRGR